MDLSKLFQSVSADVIIVLLQSAIIVNFAVYGAKLAIQAIKIGVTKSILPINFDLDKLEEMSTFNVGAGIIFAYLLALRNAGADYSWWKTLIDAVMVWMASLVSWKFGVRQITELVPALLTMIMNKIKG